MILHHMLSRKTERRQKALHMWQLAWNLNPLSALTASSSARGPQWGIMLASAPSLCSFPVLPHPRARSQPVTRQALCFLKNLTQHPRDKGSHQHPWAQVWSPPSRQQAPRGLGCGRQLPGVQNPCRHSQKMSAMFTQQKRAVWNNVRLLPFVKSFCLL